MKPTESVVFGVIAIALDETLIEGFTTAVATRVTEVPVVVTGGAV
jgi:hypothetical protein